ISLLLVYLIDHSLFLPLGLKPNKKRIIQFGLGIAISFLLSVAVESLELFLQSADISINPEADIYFLINRLWLDIKSVVTEELVFRGVILYFLLTKIGTKTGLILSSAAFGVYHWFSFGIFGSIVPMF